MNYWIIGDNLRKDFMIADLCDPNRAWENSLTPITKVVVQMPASIALSYMGAKRGQLMLSWNDRRTGSACKFLDAFLASVGRKRRRTQSLDMCTVWRVDKSLRPKDIIYGGFASGK